MVHLNDLQQRYGERGLTVLAASAQDRAAVQGFIDEFQVAYPTLVAEPASLAPFAGGGVPHAHLIGPDGRILWEGHPGNLSDAQIEEALSAARVLPAWPEALKAVRKAFAKGAYADALARLGKELERGALEAADAEAAAGIRDWLLWFGESTLEGAGRDLEAGKVYEAATAYERLAEHFPRHEIGTRAEAARKALLADPARKLEVTAAERLARILDEIRDESPRKALLKLKPLLAKKYAETAAGKRAAQLAAELEAKEEGAG